MAALATDRNTPMQHGWRVFEFTPAAGVVIFRGALCGIDAAGQLHPAGSVAGLRTVGCAENGTAELPGVQAYPQGALPAGIVVQGGRNTIRVKAHTLFALDNASNADALGAGDFGNPCYAVDDHTVAKTDGGGTRALAGIFRGLSQIGGAWVEIG